MHWLVNVVWWNQLHVTQQGPTPVQEGGCDVCEAWQPQAQSLLQWWVPSVQLPCHVPHLPWDWQPEGLVQGEEHHGPQQICNVHSLLSHWNLSVINDNIPDLCQSTVAQNKCVSSVEKSQRSKDIFSHCVNYTYFCKTLYIQLKLHIIISYGDGKNIFSKQYIILILFEYLKLALL